jgi:hypothetical protein
VAKVLDEDSILTYKLPRSDNCDVMAGNLDKDVEKLKQSLDGLPQPQVKPPLIVVSGLPGTGKSFFLPQAD